MPSGIYIRTKEIINSLKNCINKGHFKKNEKHILWKGNLVGIKALHAWVRRHKKEPLLCEGCGKKRSLDLANISQKYKRDLSDWEYLCRKCHMTKDGRLSRLIPYNGLERVLV